MSHTEFAELLKNFKERLKRFDSLTNWLLVFAVASGLAVITGKQKLLNRYAAPLANV